MWRVLFGDYLSRKEAEAIIASIERQARSSQQKTHSKEIDLLKGVDYHVIKDEFRPWR